MVNAKDWRSFLKKSTTSKKKVAELKPGLFTGDLFLSPSPKERGIRPQSGNCSAG
jgi:hypothetical protein